MSLTGLNDEQTLEHESKGSPNEWATPKEGGEREARTMLSEKWRSESTLTKKKQTKPCRDFYPSLKRSVSI